MENTWPQLRKVVTMKYKLKKCPFIVSPLACLEMCPRTQRLYHVKAGLKLVIFYLGLFLKRISM